LRAAIAGKQFEMFYQPVVSVDSNEVIAFEALIRWRHPDRGMVSPAEFIPVAEETGLIIPLGEWILRQVCTDALSWPRNIRVAVNLSPVQFRSPDLVQTVFTALAVSHLEPGRLELEITETTLLQDSEAILERLHQLKSYGVQISMDDFGTGYSSLSYLRSFPFDKIKIDQSFVSWLGKLQDSLAIIRAVISLGKNLGMTTKAEGVETADQLRILKEELCDEVQGFLFSPAVPLKETHRLLGLSRSSAVIVEGGVEAFRRSSTPPDGADIGPRGLARAGVGSRRAGPLTSLIAQFCNGDLGRRRARDSVSGRIHAGEARG
jgi:EAL domain-containing protein (putative c-di-GMP-specific phosphodiesterase class I)